MAPKPCDSGLTTASSGSRAEVNLGVRPHVSVNIFIYELVHALSPEPNRHNATHRTVTTAQPPTLRNHVAHTCKFLHAATLTSGKQLPTIPRSVRSQGNMRPCNAAGHPWMAAVHTSEPGRPSVSFVVPRCPSVSLVVPELRPSTKLQQNPKGFETLRPA